MIVAVREYLGGHNQKFRTVLVSVKLTVACRHSLKTKLAIFTLAETFDSISFSELIEFYAQAFGPDMCVSHQHLRVAVTADQSDLRYTKP